MNVKGSTVWLVVLLGLLGVSALNAADWWEDAKPLGDMYRLAGKSENIVTAGAHFADDSCNWACGASQATDWRLAENGVDGQYNPGQPQGQGPIGGNDEQDGVACVSQVASVYVVYGPGIRPVNGAFPDNANFGYFTFYCKRPPAATECSFPAMCRRIWVVDANLETSRGGGPGKCNWPSTSPHYGDGSEISQVQFDYSDDSNVLPISRNTDEDVTEDDLVPLDFTFSESLRSVPWQNGAVEIRIAGDPPEGGAARPNMKIWRSATKTPGTDIPLTWAPMSQMYVATYGVKDSSFLEEVFNKTLYLEGCRTSIARHDSRVVLYLREGNPASLAVTDIVRYTIFDLGNVEAQDPDGDWQSGHVVHGWPGTPSVGIRAAVGPSGVPGGYFTWSLTAPAGSDAEIEDSSALQTSITGIDRPGLYTATANLGNVSKSVSLYVCKVSVVHPQAGDFAAGKAGRILISSADGFHTSAATTKADGVAQTAARKVTITAYVTPHVEGATVYFRAKDPDDPSVYQPDEEGDDNRDQSTLNNKQGDFVETDTAIASATTSIVTIDGVERCAAEVNLWITGRHSGDNYLVEASCDEQFSEFEPTSVFTAWKRCYVEVDKMFRYGEDCLDAGSGVGASGNVVYVNDTTVYSAGDWVQVIDSQDDNHNAGQIRQVDSVDLQSTPARLLLTSSLTMTYNVPDHAHVGKVVKNGGEVNVDSTYYTVDTALVTAAFDDAFIEYEFPPDGASLVPFRPYFSTLSTDAEIWSAREEIEGKLSLFSQPWFKNRQYREDDELRSAGRESAATGKPNYFHLFPSHADVPEEREHFVGYAVSVWNGNCLTLFMVRIMGTYSANVQNANRVIGVHELCHQFQVAFDSETPLFLTHCGEMAYAVDPPDNAECVMYPGYPGQSGLDPTRGIARFCTHHLLDGFTTLGYHQESLRDQLDGR